MNCVEPALLSNKPTSAKKNVLAHIHTHRDTPKPSKPAHL